MNYPDLHRQYNWAIGVHRSPAGYEHPWIVVMRTAAVGCWSRAEARAIWSGYKGVHDRLSRKAAE